MLASSIASRRNRVFRQDVFVTLFYYLNRNAIREPSIDFKDMVILLRKTSDHHDEFRSPPLDSFRGRSEGVALEAVCFGNGRGSA
jgi:hypothetical protein